MTSDLSIFAARLRDFICIFADERPFVPGETAGAALEAHYDAEFNGMALVLFTLQFHRNPAYRKLCEARRVTPDSVTHWTQIPAVPAVAFKELELTCLPMEHRTNEFHSSGTTEQKPSRHFHSTESLALYEASLWPWFRTHLLSGLTPGVWRVALLTPPPHQAPHSSLGHMFNVVRREMAAPGAVFVGRVASDGAWALDFDAASATLRGAEESNRPLVLLGTAFSFVHLVDFLAEKNIRFQLPSESRAMETGGYKGRSRVLPKAKLHSLITERLGIPPSHIVCEYGMSELSSQAYDLEARGARGGVSGKERLFRFPPWARFQVIAPETGREAEEGETGLLRVFDLANVFSTMAIQTEDLAVRRGDGFELIGRAELAEVRGCSLMAADSSIVNHRS